MLQRNMKNWNRTKIIATIGPASNSERLIKRLIREGMDIARINLSYGTKTQQRVLVRLLRSVSQEMRHHLGILVDIPGPKIRLGPLRDRAVFLRKGALFRLTAEKVMGDERWAGLNYPSVIKAIKKGMRIYLNDGLIKLRVLEIKENQAVCFVENSGEVRTGKGVNIPGIELGRYFSAREDAGRISYAAGLEPDFIALSFIREAEDLRRLRRVLGRKNEAFLIAKIEKRDALRNLDSIVEASDGVMVARGDLGVEISLEELPLVQKDIIAQCNLKAKPVIVATQMLVSMVDSPVPTRAEVTDIANAVLDGADCLMLSDETAVGRYPVEALATLRKVALITERRFPCLKYLNRQMDKYMNTLEAVSYAAAWTAYNLNVDCLVVPTFSGETARWISRFRPPAMVFVLASRPNILRRLGIFWGVYPVFFPFKISLEKLPAKVEFILKKLKLVRSGDRVVITASNPMGETGKTNLIQVHEIA